MENQVQAGMNRTGAQMAPLKSEDAEQFAHSRLGEGSRDGAQYAAMHMEYIQEADRVGSVPPPATVKGMANAVVSKLKGEKPSVLLDKLGERLAFERTGVRLYEALILKCSALEALDTAAGTEIDLDALRSIRDDEETHFRLLTEAMRVLGGDPTAMTPCADIAGVSGSGWLQVITDPRTTVAQALNTMLSAELTDNAGWELLIQLASEAGHKDMAEGFAVAETAERRHLENVKAWLQTAVLAEAT
jgi:hypothetical protein